MNTQTTHRYSKQRECILEVLRRTKAHPTANWVYDNVRQIIPNISLGTVYRNLSVLCKDKIVLKLDVGDGTERYDANSMPHYHLYCTKCGSISDLRMEYENILDEKVAKQNGCKIDYHSLLFSGLCKECNK